MRIDFAKRTVELRGEPVKLTYVEFEILSALARSPGRVFSRSMLLERLWGDSAYRDPRTIDVHIGRLRVKLSQAGRSAPQIVSVRGFGYKIVTSTPGAAPASNEPEASLADGLRS